MPTRDGATLIPTGSVSSMTGSTGAPEAAGVGGGVIAAPSSHDLYRLLNNRFRLSMKQQQKAVYWSCGIQLVLSFIALIVVAAGGGSGAATAQNITTTVVTFILAIVGLYGVYKHDRGALLLFFIGEIWTLASVTAYVQSSMRARANNDLMCKQLQYTADKEACSGATVVDTINLMLGGCIVIAAAIGSYVSARLSENIQEEALTRTSSAYKKTA